MLLVVASVWSLGMPQILRPVTAPAGFVEAGVGLEVLGIEAIGAEVDGRYAVSDRLELGAWVPGMLRQPDTSCSCRVVAGAMGEVRWQVGNGVALDGGLGYIDGNGTPFVRYALPEYGSNLVVTLSAGVTMQRAFGKRFALSSAPRLVIQPGAGGGEAEFGGVYTVNLPVMAHVQVTDTVAVSLESGIDVIEDRGGGTQTIYRVPVVASADATLAGGRFAVGAWLGLPAAARDDDGPPSASWVAGASLRIRAD